MISDLSKTIQRKSIIFATKLLKKSTLKKYLQVITKGNDLLKIIAEQKKKNSDCEHRHTR